jgi:hypothetical protein
MRLASATPPPVNRPSGKLRAKLTSPASSRPGQGLDDVESGADSDKLADLAVKALQEAVAAGFTDGPRLRGDPAFAALRDRADFEAIVSALPSGKER